MFPACSFLALFQLFKVEKRFAHNLRVVHRATFDPLKFVIVEEYFERI
jgi:hypothetical protein